MTLEEFSFVAEIIGAAAVIFSLIYVARQISQNSNIAKAQIINDFYLADMELELSMMGEEPIKPCVKAVLSPDELTPEEVAILDRYFNYAFIQLARLQKMNELGLATEEWADSVKTARWQLGNDIGKRWWANSKDGYSEEFQSMVDEALDPTDPNPNMRMINSLIQPNQSKNGLEDNSKLMSD